MVDRGEVYRALSARYGFSPHAIAAMTPAQQMMYLEDGVDPRTGRSYVKVATEREARELLAQIGG